MNICSTCLLTEEVNVFVKVQQIYTGICWFQNVTALVRLAMEAVVEIVENVMNATLKTWTVVMVSLAKYGL